MSPPRSTGTAGQASVLVVGALAAILLGAFVLGAAAKGVGERSKAQRQADLAALAGARALHSAYPRLFEPAYGRRRANPRHLEKSEYLALGRRAARVTAERNGATDVAIAFPDGASFAPVRIRATVTRRVTVERGAAREGADVRGVAEAELAPPDQLGLGGTGTDEYAGPLEHRQGKPMRPDVARAFDRMARAAAGAGVDLVITSGFRSNAQQAALFAAHPDPKWVAPPGRSLHRLATELDLGPRSAYGWLAANAKRFHFLKRYAWEPWHFGYTLNAASGGGGGGGGSGGDGERQGSAVPAFVPERFTRPIARAAQRWNVSAALLSAQLYAESNFNPFARSPAGAQGPGAVHAGHGGGLRLEEPIRPRGVDRRPGPLDARPAAPVRGRAARARRLQRGSGAGGAVRMRAAVSRDARLRRADPRPDGRRGGGDARRWGRGPARRMRCGAIDHSRHGSGSATARLRPWTPPVGTCAPGKELSLPVAGPSRPRGMRVGHPGDGTRAVAHS
jgi:hypothetical protein